MPNTINANRIVGNILVVGGVNAAPGSITVKGATPGANDGTLTVAGARNAQSLALAVEPTLPFNNTGIAPLWLNGALVATQTDALRQLQPYMRRRRLLLSDAVPGQPSTYYIDKAATTYGYNVALDAEGLPLIRLVIGGVERFWGPEADFDVVGVPADFDVVRSQSTGPEGFAAVGSKNAIKINGSPTSDIWYYYHRKTQAVS